MSLKLEGTIERRGIGPGTWALVTEDGQSYELNQGSPDELLKSGLKVKIQGQVRDDVMTFAAIGPVLEVKSFEVLDNK